MDSKTRDKGSDDSIVPPFEPFPSEETEQEFSNATLVVESLQSDETFQDISAVVPTTSTDDIMDPNSEAANRTSSAESVRNLPSLEAPSMETSTSIEVLADTGETGSETLEFQDESRPIQNSTSTEPNDPPLTEPSRACPTSDKSSVAPSDPSGATRRPGAVYHSPRPPPLHSMASTSTMSSRPSTSLLSAATLTFASPDTVPSVVPTLTAYRAPAESQSDVILGYPVPSSPTLPTATTRSNQTERDQRGMIVVASVLMIAILVVVTTRVSGVIGPNRDATSPNRSNVDPTMCRDALISFVNNITLSGRAIAYHVVANESTSGALPPEEAALQWLIEDDPLLFMSSATSLVDQFRIQQRYALGTLWFSTARWQVVEGFYRLV